MSNPLKTPNMTPIKKPEIFSMAAASLSAKVTQWLAEHPEEFLSVQDVSIKFSARRNSIAACLRGAVAARVLTAKPNPHDTRKTPERVYQIGTADWRIDRSPAECDREQQPAATVWRIAANQPTSRSPFHQVEGQSAKHLGGVIECPTALEIAALRAETGVPIVGKSKAHADAPKWSPVFELLTQPGVSVAFPSAWKTGVAAYAVKLHRKLGQRAYHVRSVSKDQARIWRVA